MQEKKLKISKSWKGDADLKRSSDDSSSFGIKNDNFKVFYKGLYGE